MIITYATQYDCVAYVIIILRLLLSYYDYPYYHMDNNIRDTIWLCRVCSSMTISVCYWAYYSHLELLYAGSWKKLACFTQMSVVANQSFPLHKELGTGIWGLIRGLPTFLQFNQKPLMVKEIRLEDPQVIMWWACLWNKIFSF